MANRVPAEMHVYEVGGHGFGVFREGRPADWWAWSVGAVVEARSQVILQQTAPAAK